jgi:nucleoside 2-deoxyribosyltransferase
LEEYGRDREHGTMSRWMHELGYFSNREKSVFLVSEKASMQKEKNTPETPLEFENLQLQNRILELEKQLQESEMKAIAWRTMVEVAEQEFNISIKKKFNTKSSKK